MLVLSRKVNETIVIDGGIRITFLGARGASVRIGVEAPREVSVLRGELPPQSRDRSWGHDLDLTNG